MFSNLLRQLLALSALRAVDGEGGADDRGDDLTAVADDAPLQEAKEDPKSAPKAADGPKGVDGLRDADAEPIATEVEVEGEEGEAKPKVGKDSRVPLARHQAILDKERERRVTLERQLAQFQQGEKVAQVNQDITKGEDAILSMEEKYNKLLMDGKADEALRLMAQIRTAERALSEQKSDLKIEAASIQARELARYDTAVERVEEAYPALNPDAEDYDHEKAKEVVELKTAYMKVGRTPTDALQKAVKLVMGAPKTAAEKNAVEVTPRVAEADVAAARRKAAADKTAAAIGKTPSNTAKAGTDSDKLGGGMTAKDVMNMHQDEFAKLPSSVLSKMRGDTL